MPIEKQQIRTKGQHLRLPAAVLSSKNQRLWQSATKQLYFCIACNMHVLFFKNSAKSICQLRFKQEQAKHNLVLLFKAVDSDIQHHKQTEAGLYNTGYRAILSETIANVLISDAVIGASAAQLETAWWSNILHDFCVNKLPDSTYRFAACFQHIQLHCHFGRQAISCYFEGTAQG